MSMERPVLGGLSPSLSVLHPASEIKARLNFSSVKTPPLKTKKVFLNDVRSPSNFNNRLGEYHMSKQNPAVLDQMYSSSSSPQKDHLYKAVTPLISRTTRLNGSGILVGNDSTPAHTSLLKQTLGKIHRNSLPGHSSLVQLAVRGTQRQYDSIGISPVIIKLSGPESTTGGGLEPELGMETNLWQNDVRAPVANPCDKNVVLSALKQKRKRWATSSDDDSLTDIVLPQAKRSRHSTQASSSAPSSPSCSKLFFERKRSNMASSAHFSPALKRTRVADMLVDKLRARGFKNSARQFTVPEIEYESDGESVSGGGVKDVREASVEPSDGMSADTRSVGSVEERSATPPVQEEEEDVQLKKRQKESLKFQKSLTAVFPSSLARKSSSRRKLPVFCATGSKPHLPAPLSVTHSATQDDLKKDREAATSRIKHFLSEDEEQPRKDDASTVSSTPSATVSPSVLPPALSTTSAASGGLQLGIPATLTTASTDHTSAVTSTVASTTAVAMVTLTGSSHVPSIHGSSLVCTTTTNVPLMSTGVNSVSAPLTSVSSLPKSVSFALPPSATGSLTTTQSQIQMAAASTSASGLSSQTDTRLNPKGSGSSGASLPSAAASMVNTNLSFQFPPAATTSSSNGSTLLTSTVGNQHSQLASAVPFQFGPAAQKNLFTGVQGASSNGASTNTSSRSLALPTTTTQPTLAGLFSQNATSLQTSSSLFAGIQNAPGNGTGAVLSVPVSTSPSFFPQNATPFQTSSSSLFAGVPSNGTAASAPAPSLALPTAASQQTLPGFFSQSTASLQTPSSNLFASVSSSSNGTNPPAPALASASQQTFNFFSQNATPQQTSTNLFAGVKTTGASTSTTNSGFTFNLANGPVTSQQKQVQFGQIQTAPGNGAFAVQHPLSTATSAPNGMGGLQNQSRTVKFNIPTTTASNGFPGGTQQHQQQRQQQQQNKAIPFFGTNAQTKPPSFNFTAGVGGLNNTNTGGLFPKSNGSNGFNFSTPSQNSAGLFNSAQQLTPAAPSTFNFTAGANSSLPKQQPPSQQQQPNAFFSGVAGTNQTPKPSLPFSQTQGNGGLFNFGTNGSAQSQNGGVFSSGLKSSDQMAFRQQTTQNRTQNGFDFTAGAGMGVKPFNFTADGNLNPSFNQPAAMFGNQGNAAPGFGGFQTPQTALSFATPNNGGLNFNFGVGGGNADSSRRPRRRRGRK